MLFDSFTGSRLRPRITRRRNEKRSHSGGGIADACPHRSSHCGRVYGAEGSLAVARRSSTLRGALRLAPSEMPARKLDRLDAEQLTRDEPLPLRLEELIVRRVDQRGSHLRVVPVAADEAESGERRFLFHARRPIASVPLLPGVATLVRWRSAKTSATSLSSRTSTTGKRRSSTRCCGSPARSAPTRTSQNACSTRWTSSARRASRSSPRTPPSA